MIVERTRWLHVRDARIATLAEGVLLPFGGHKGSALALIVELLSGPLVGAGRRDRNSFGTRYR